MKWDRFKEIVKTLRKKQEWLIYAEQKGRSEVMFEIAVYSKVLNDIIRFPPHSINLRTGKVFAEVGGQCGTYDIKGLLEESEI